MDKFPIKYLLPLPPLQMINYTFYKLFHMFLPCRVMHTPPPLSSHSVANLLYFSMNINQQICDKNSPPEIYVAIMFFYVVRGLAWPGDYSYSDKGPCCWLINHALFAISENLKKRNIYHKMFRGWYNLLVWC